MNDIDEPPTSEPTGADVVRVPGQPLGDPPADRYHNRAIEARAERNAVNTRALLAASMATKAPVSPAALVTLSLTTLWLFLAEDILSIPLATDTQHFVLDNTGLAIVLGFAVIWWSATEPRNLGAAALCVLCAVVLLATAAGLIDAPVRGRWTDLVAGVVILVSVLVRMVPFGTEEP